MQYVVPSRREKENGSLHRPFVEPLFFMSERRRVYEKNNRREGSEKIIQRAGRQGGNGVGMEPQVSEEPKIHTVCTTLSIPVRLGDLTSPLPVPVSYHNKYIPGLTRS